MKAFLSDFFLLMVTVSVCGSLLLLGVEVLRRVLHAAAVQVSVAYKLIIIFYFVSALMLLVVLGKTAMMKYVPSEGVDFDGYWTYRLPIAYRFYDYYRELDWLAYVLAAWSAGVVVTFFLGNVMSRRQLKILKKLSTTCTGGRVEEFACRLAEEYHIKSRVRIYYLNIIRSPFVAGIGHPMIFLPQREFSEGDLEFILRHELIHYKKGDILFRQSLIYIKCFYWFNPLTYLLARGFCDSCEMACDEFLLRHSGRDQRWEYARCIADFTENEKNLSHVVGICSGNIVEKRLAAIADSCKLAQRNQREKRKRAFAVYGSMGLLFIVCVFLAMAGFMGLRISLAEWMEKLHMTPV